jgi:dTDP-4-dehydrorhamnose reductase
MSRQQVLITGANGFLGNYLCKNLLAQQIPVVATSKGMCRLPYEGDEGFVYLPLDFTDINAVYSIIEKVQPTTIIHAGAMCKPDECEQNKEAAWLVNVTGTKYLLEAAATKNIHFIFISTDFVFDGSAECYNEEDNPNPVNYYGLTKMKAEALLANYNGPFAIVRTVLVYGKPLSGRSNLLTVVKQKLENKETYFVVNDQVRTPTYVNDLAWAIIQITAHKKEGIWHVSGQDVMTPFEMACSTADYLQLDTSFLKSIASSDLNQPAMRPPKTSFVLAKAKKELGYHPTSFTEGLRLTFD